ncbi:hypothetical protein K443DRAFT_681255 [Laccaria amethystina LaAM-08-1]|uniref:Ubiquitin 3 binding protein But2 C-terminal domain-containing protein n=1 Tax=Laccaria amethystina LaAM-08-1 TaxID=1095629 RepID=A0A0C9XP89_9AGAR|nr:hypothetical protein K443DRAFT_681255 [Laccaria amethystina LaAM-08-1]
MKFASLALLASLLTAASAIVVPGASTPLFYLVASSSSSSANLLPVLLSGTLGTPSSTNAAAQFYFSQGSFFALSSSSGSPPTFSPSPPYKVYYNSVPASDCTTFGQLSFIQGSTTNKCAQFTGFGLQSDTENSQLGAQLVVNSVGGFYLCAGNAVYYKLNPTDGPSGCSPVSLYTVPVVA